MINRRSFCFLLIVFFVFVVVVSAETIQDDLHLNIQVTDVSGNVLTGTFNFQFDIATDASCSNVVYSDSTSLTTDSRGIVSYYLDSASMNYQEQYYLCYYRNSVLVDTIQIARTPYSFSAKNVNVSGLIVDSNLNMSGFNVYADKIGVGEVDNNFALNVFGNVSIGGNSFIYFPNDGTSHEVHNSIRIRASLQPGPYSEIQMPTAYGGPFTFKSAANSVGVRVTDFVGLDYSELKDTSLYFSPFTNIIVANSSARKLIFGDPYNVVSHLNGVDVYVWGGRAPYANGVSGGDLYLSGGYANMSLNGTSYGDVYLAKEGGNIYVGGKIYGDGSGLTNISINNSEINYWKINGSDVYYDEGNILVGQNAYLGLNSYSMGTAYNFTVGTRADNNILRSAEIVFRQTSGEGGEVAIRAYQSGAAWSRDNLLIRSNSAIFSSPLYATSYGVNGGLTSLSDGVLTLRSNLDNYILFVDNGAAYRGALGFINNDPDLVYKAGGTSLASGVEVLRVKSSGLNVNGILAINDSQVYVDEEGDMVFKV